MAINDFFMKKLPFKKKNYDEIIAVDALTESNCCFLAIKMTPWCVMPQGGAGAPKWWLGRLVFETKLLNEGSAEFHAAPCSLHVAVPDGAGSVALESRFHLGDRVLDPECY